MIRDYLAGYDFDLPLNDAMGDPELSPARRSLAGAARGAGLDAGYYEAQELAEVFLESAREANAGMVEDNSPARLRMRAVLARDLAYQRTLFAIVAAQPLPDEAADLCWLADLMMHRADMYRPVAKAQGR